MRRFGWILGILLWSALASAQDSISLSLTNGDANRDNQVDDADLTAVLFAFGSSEQRADLNEDGIVDDADLTTVLFSFGQVGEAPLTGERVGAYGTHFLDVHIQLANAGDTRWREVWVEAQLLDDVVVYQTQGWIQGSSGTVSVALPEAGVYRLQVWVANGSWLRTERQVQVGLRVRDLVARPGNGCAVLMWEELPDDSFLGYRVYRRVGTGSWTQVATLPASAFLYADTALTNGTRYEYKVVVVGLDGTPVHESPTVSVVPTASVARLVWDSLSYGDGTVRVAARMSSGAIPNGYNCLIVDGVPWGALGEYADAPGRLLGFIATSDVPLSSHTLQAVIVTPTHAFATPVANMTFGSDTGVLQSPNLMYLGGTARLRMELPSDVNSWQLKVVRARDNQEIVSWSGSLPLIDLVWNGRDASGNETEEGLYWVQVLASRASGATVRTSRPLHRLPRILGPLDAIALLPGDVGDRRVIVEQANWIASRLQIIKERSGGSFKYCVYIHSPSMQGRAHQRFVADLVGLMGSTLRVFYMRGHANPESISWGGYVFTSRQGNWPRGRIISIPSVVGSHQYRFVFLHGCQTAAGNELADAFNAEFYLGWKRTKPVAQFVGGAIDEYTQFDMFIWGDLAAGFTIFQALNFTCGFNGRLWGRPPCLDYRGTCEANIEVEGPDCRPMIWGCLCPQIRLP